MGRRVVRVVRPVVRWGAGALAVFSFGTALFERLAPRPAVRAYQRFANRFQRPLMGVLPGWAVLETTGRRSGLPRQTPVGGRVVDDTFWLVAGDSRHSAYVGNLEANPRVRVRVRGRWRSGTAHVLRDDDPVRRLLRINPFNSLFVWLANPRSDMLTVRIDLDNPTSG